MAEGKMAVLVVLVCTLLSAFLPSVLSLSKCTMIDACSASTDKGTIDLWPLVAAKNPPRFKNIKESGGKTNNSYSWNPCNPWTEGATSETNKCQDVAVCLSIDSGAAYYGVGKANTAGFKLDSGTGDCSITYTGHFASEVSTQVLINLNCNEDEEGRIDEFIHNLQHPAIIKATLHSKYACPYKSLSFGSILLIIFFSVLAIYLLGGMLFLKFSRGATGKELLPNYPFWFDLFILIQEGCVFTFIKVRGLCGGKSTSYQSI